MLWVKIFPFHKIKQDRKIVCAQFIHQMFELLDMNQIWATKCFLIAGNFQFSSNCRRYWELLKKKKKEICNSV